MSEMQAVIYARISETDKDVDKVENQITRLRTYAELKGYTVTAMFKDDGVSAFDGSERPGFIALSKAIRAGKFGMVLATEQERLGRNVAEWEPVIELLREANVPYDTIRGGGPWDMTKADHRKYSRSKVVDASGESEVRIERQNARNQDELAQGNALWGPRPFGFESEGGRVVGINEAEAEAIRKATDDILNGTTVYAVSKAWNNQKLRTPRGAMWMPSTVRQALLRDRNAGWLTYKGDRISRTLPEIVNPETFESLVALLTAPGRKPKAGPKEKGLLSGLIRCHCGAGMTRSTTQNIYKCTRRYPGTQHQSIATYHAEDVVVEAVLQHIADGGLDAPEEDREEIADINAKITEANRRRTVIAEDMEAPGYDRAYGRKRLADLSAEVAGLEAELTALLAQRAQGSAFEEFRAHFANGWTDSAADDSAAVDRAYNAWEALSLAQQRDIIAGSFLISLGEGRGEERVVVEKA